MEKHILLPKLLGRIANDFYPENCVYSNEPLRSGSPRRYNTHPCWLKEFRVSFLIPFPFASGVDTSLAFTLFDLFLSRSMISSPLFLVLLLSDFFPSLPVLWRRNGWNFCIDIDSDSHCYLLTLHWDFFTGRLLSSLSAKAFSDSSSCSSFSSRVYLLLFFSTLTLTVCPFDLICRSVGSILPDNSNCYTLEVSHHGFYDKSAPFGQRIIPYTEEGCMTPSLPVFHFIPSLFPTKSKKAVKEGSFELWKRIVDSFLFVPVSCLPFSFLSCYFDPWSRCSYRSLYKERAVKTSVVSCVTHWKFAARTPLASWQTTSGFSIHFFLQHHLSVKPSLFLSFFPCLPFPVFLSLSFFLVSSSFLLSLPLDMKLGENLGMALAHSYLMIGVIPGTQDLASYFSSSRGLTGVATSGASSSNTTSIDSLSQVVKALDTAAFNSLSIRPRERKYKQ